MTANPDTGALTYRQYRLSDNWLPGADLSGLQLTDVDADGIPDLRTVTTGGEATAYRITNLSETGPAKIKAGAAQPLA